MIKLGRAKLTSIEHNADKQIAFFDKDGPIEYFFSTTIKSNAKVGMITKVKAIKSIMIHRYIINLSIHSPHMTGYPFG